MSTYHVTIHDETEYNYYSIRSMYKYNRYFTATTRIYCVTDAHAIVIL